MEDLYPTRGDTVRQAARVDPVVHSSNKDNVGAELMAKLERFAKDGFLFLPELLPVAETDSLMAEAERLRAQAQTKSIEEVIREGGNGDVRSIFAIHRTSKVFAKVSRDPRLLDLVMAILGDDVYVHQSRINYKPAFCGREFFWHSDFETWHAEDGMQRMRAVSVSILLTRSYATNGPLMLIPGSQDTFLSCAGATPEDHYKKSLVKQEYGMPDLESLTKMAVRRGIKSPIGGAGSVVCFDCNTMHGSNSNITPFPRTNLFIVYNAVSNKLVDPFAAKKPRPEFVATREHMEILPRRKS
jgi:ectoine hydroxylase